MKKITVTMALVATMMIGCGGGSGGDNTNGNSNGASGGGTHQSDNGSSNIDKSKVIQRGKILYNTSSESTQTADDYYFKMTTTGKKRLVFTDFGKKMIEEKTENSNTVMKVGGQTSNDSSSSHDLTKTINFVSYDVDFENKKIKKTDYSDIAGALARPGVANALVKQFNDSNLTDKIIGSENILGYPCEIHEMASMHAKTWYYKNIPLKMVIDRTDNSDGVTIHMIITEEATSIDLDHEPSESEFTLPNYPIVEY